MLRVPMPQVRAQVHVYFPRPGFPLVSRNVKCQVSEVQQAMVTETEEPGYPHRKAWGPSSFQPESSIGGKGSLHSRTGKATT